MARQKWLASILSHNDSAERSLGAPAWAVNVRFGIDQDVQVNDAKLAALFLLAIGTKRDESDVALRDIIAAADFHERIVLEHGEIEAAVRFLLARHLITADSDQFALTPAGRGLAEGPLPRTYDAARRRLEAILENLSEEQPTAEWSLDPARANAAVDVYDEMWRTQRES